MKKFLSLVLALVMTMSLVVVGASASSDFSDASSIQYPEAVDVVAACKIIDGYADGSFKGTDTLTRGAAAKIICNMVLGPTTASALGADVKPFPDVATNHTFAGYIAYCAQQGIINGYADGNFYPAKTVTGYQFMKMLLGALGYDGKLEGYTGGNWSVNVAKTALGIGLDDGNDDFVGTTAMTREEACLYAFNTIKADLVEYDNNLIINDGQISTSSKAKSMTYTEAGITAAAARQIEDESESTPIAQFGEKYFKDLKKTATGVDDYGCPANEWTYKGDKVGTYADSTNILGTYTKGVKKGDLYTLIGGSNVKKLTASASALTDNSTNKLVVYKDGKIISTSSEAITDYFQMNNTKKIGANGVLTKIYRDDDNNVTVVMIVAYLVQATKDYSSSNENLTVALTDNMTVTLATDSKTLAQDDFAVESYKEDDYILVTGIVENNKLTICDIAPASMVSGKVTTYTVESSVSLDGTSYDYAKVSGYGEDGGDPSFSVDDSAKVVKDAYGYIIYVDEKAVASTSYVYVQDTQTSSGLKSTYQSGIIALDGTYSTVNVKSIDDASASANTFGWYTYSKTSDGKYKFTTPKNNNAVSGQFIVDVADTQITQNDEVKVFNVSTSGTGKGMVADDIKADSNKYAYYNASGVLQTDNTLALDTIRGLKATNSTVFVVYDSDEDVNVYTGIKNVPDITTGSTENVHVSYVTDKNNNYLAYVAIDLYNDDTATTEESGTDNGDLVYILKGDPDVTKVDSDTLIYTYKALKNGEETKVKVSSDCKNAADLTTQTLYRNVKTDSNGYITSMKPVENGSNSFYTGAFTNAEIAYKDDVLTIGNTDLQLGSNATITLIDYTSATKNPGDTYAVSTVSGSALKSDFKDYMVTGAYAYKGVSSDDNTVVSLYITVTHIGTLNLTLPDNTTTNGVTASFTEANATALPGDTVKVTVKLNGTASAATTFTLAGVDTLTLKEELDSVTVSGKAINVSAATFTNSTLTFTFTMPAADVTLTCAGANT